MLFRERKRERKRERERHREARKGVGGGGKESNLIEGKVEFTLVSL